MVSNVSFREQVRRTWSGMKSPMPKHGASNHHHDTMGEPNERTRLLDPGHGNSDSSTGREHGPVWKFLLSSKDTPGRHSDRLAVRSAAHVWHVTKCTLLCSPINILLPFVPLGLIAGELGWGPVSVFTLNFFAIIPLAAMLTFATEELSEEIGGALGGLINATFGNAVELIVSILALRAGEIEVVQSSMLGSILSNLLLVMGMCFFLGGIKNMKDANGRGIEQIFASGTAQTTCSLMALSSGSLVLPAALYNTLSGAEDEDKRASILQLSRGTAIILLVLYALYLFFQLSTHQNLFEPESSENGKSGPEDGSAATSPAQNGENGRDVESGAATVAVGNGDDDSSHLEREKRESKVWAWSMVVVLLAVTVVISKCADYLVESIDAIAATGVVSKTFIGLILIPIVGNAAEHVTACVMAYKDNMDLAMGVAIGSSIQIALLVTPALVILGWIMGQPMTLHFEMFETIAFALSVIIVASMVQDGRSNYLEGAMLMGFYVIIALAFWASPPDSLGKH